MIYRVEDKESEKVSNLLNDNNIPYERYYGALGAFSKEESIYRVDCFEDENKVILTDEQREYLEGAVECALDNDDYIVDGDYLWDVSNNALTTALNEYNETNKDKPEKIMTKAMRRG